VLKLSQHRSLAWSRALHDNLNLEQSGNRQQMIPETHPFPIGEVSDEMAVFHHKALLIIVTKSAKRWSLYDATRYAWKIDIKRAIEADVILPTIQGLIVGAFVADTWLEATAENFPSRAEQKDEPGRFGFIGKEAPSHIMDLYVGKRVPDAYRRKGAANPIRYTW